MLRLAAAAGETGNALGIDRVQDTITAPTFTEPVRVDEGVELVPAVLDIVRDRRRKFLDMGAKGLAA